MMVMRPAKTNIGIETMEESSLLKDGFQPMARDQLGSIHTMKLLTLLIHQTVKLSGQQTLVVDIGDCCLNSATQLQAVKIPSFETTMLKMKINQWHPFLNEDGEWIYDDDVEGGTGTLWNKPGASGDSEAPHGVGSSFDQIMDFWDINIYDDATYSSQPTDANAGSSSANGLERYHVSTTRLGTATKDFCYDPISWNAQQRADTTGRTIEGNTHIVHDVLAGESFLNLDIPAASLFGQSAAKEHLTHFISKVGLTRQLIQQSVSQCSSMFEESMESNLKSVGEIGLLEQTKSMIFPIKIGISVLIKVDFQTQQLLVQETTFHSVIFQPILLA